MDPMVARAVLALLVSGCLANPAPRASDAGLPDATPIATFPFPPGDKPIHIVSGGLADLNGDGKDDVLLASAFADDQVTEGHGIYVLLGSTQGFGKTHAGFLSTFASAIAPMPMAVAAADIRGSSAIDVLALSRLPEADPELARTFLVLFENLGGLSFAAPLFKETGQRGAGAPEWNRHNAVLCSDFDGDTSTDIVFATEAQVHTSEIPRDEPRGFEEMLPEIVLRNEVTYFSFIGEVMLLPAKEPALPPDLIVADTNLYAYHNDGTTWSFSNVMSREINPAVTFSFATLGNLIGDEEPEVVGGWIRSLGVVSPRPDPAPEWRFAELPPADTEGNFDDVRVADFDPSTPLNHDAVLLDDDTGDTGRQGSVNVLSNVYVDAEGFLRTPGSELRYTLPTGYRVAVFLIGDFNGDKTPEVFLMDRKGTALCLSVTPLVGIKECAFSGGL
jgi:hypothetical protein